MHAPSPETENAPQNQSDASRRGRARQRQMARYARRGFESVEAPQVTRAPRPSPRTVRPEVGDVLARVIDGASAAWGAFASRSLRGQATLIAVVFVGLVGVFSLLSLNASGNILPGVAVEGISVAGLSSEAAAVRLSDAWSEQRLTLRDGERTWTFTPEELGIRIDAHATAEQAAAYGRDQGLGGTIRTALGGVTLSPVLEFDYEVARDAALRIASEVYVPPQNATIQMQGELVTHINAEPGRKLNFNEFYPMLTVAPEVLLRQGMIDLPMEAIPALITDAASLVNYAQELISRPLRIEAYDPVSDDSYSFSMEAGAWGEWLDTRLVLHETGPRLYLSAAAAPVRAYLVEQAAALPEPLTLDFGDGVQAVQEAIADGSLATWVTVRYKPIEYTIGRGETAYNISRTQGIPFYLIEQANPDRDLSELYVGDVITLPSRDLLLPLRPVRNKRIIVDLSEQALWAYEDGQLVFEWLISSGISSAPTSTGVFQILSHVDRAYGSSFTLCDEDTCGQWVMHWFMGIYEAVPGLMNGFHGAVELPNGGYLGGGQVGRPYTFGCIMSLDENAQLLYQWAEQGVVVEIRQ